MAALTDLLAQLSVHAKNEDHERIYSDWLDHLKRFPNEPLYLKHCLIALIKSDNFVSAERLLKKYSAAAEKDPESILVERAYIYYKLDKSSDLHKLSSDNRAFKHILAQDYYKNGENLKALQIYHQLIQSNEIIDNQLDLSCNERAVISQYKNTSNTPLESLIPISPVFPDSYDQLFNNALIEVNNRNYTKALDLFKSAERICQEANNELTEAELFSEIAPIRIQIAYVQELLGNSNEAKKILDSFNLPSITDSMIKLICFNNYLSLSNLDDIDINTTLLCREIEFPTILNKLKSKLTVPQLQILTRNSLLLSFISGRDISKISKSYNIEYPDSLLPQGLVAASKADIDLLDNNDESNAKKLFKYSMKNNTDVGASLLAAHLSCIIENYDNASLVLENLISADKEKLLAAPGVVGALLAVYDVLNKQEATISILNDIYDLYIMKEITDINQYNYLKIISFKILPHDKQKAFALFEKLKNIESDDLISTVLSSSTASLLPLSSLTAGINVEQLISEGIHPLIKKRSKTQSFKIKKQRVRKTRLPKSIIEKIGNGVLNSAEEGKEKLDKERWLPLKIRSYYKPKRGKKSKDVQGGNADNNTEVSFSSSTTTSASSSGKPKNNKKSKKKGKRA